MRTIFFYYLFFIIGCRCTYAAELTKFSTEFSLIRNNNVLKIRTIDYSEYDLRQYAGKKFELMAGKTFGRYTFCGYVKSDYAERLWGGFRADYSFRSDKLYYILQARAFMGLNDRTPGEIYFVPRVTRAYKRFEYGGLMQIKKSEGSNITGYLGPIIVIGLPGEHRISFHHGWDVFGGGGYSFVRTTFKL